MVSSESSQGDRQRTIYFDNYAINKYLHGTGKKAMNLFQESQGIENLGFSEEVTSKWSFEGQIGIHQTKKWSKVLQAEGKACVKSWKQKETNRKTNPTGRARLLKDQLNMCIGGVHIGEEFVSSFFS